MCQQFLLLTPCWIAVFRLTPKASRCLIFVKLARAFAVQRIFLPLIVKPRKLHSLSGATLLLAGLTMSLSCVCRYRVMLRMRITHDPLPRALAFDQNHQVIGVASEAVSSAFQLAVELVQQDVA